MLSLSEWLVRHRDGLAVRSQSPMQVGNYTERTQPLHRATNAVLLIIPSDVFPAASWVEKN